MKRRIARWLSVAALACLGQGAALAADTDLFAPDTTSNTGPRINILLILDNSAEFSASVTSLRCSITTEGVVKTDGTGTAHTRLDKQASAVQQCALYSVIDGLEAAATEAEAEFRLGVMAYNSSGIKTYNPASDSFTSDCTSGKGGCLIMPLTALTTTNKPRMLNWIRQWESSGNSDYNIKSNTSRNGASMQESWAYFQGKTGVSGRSYSGSTAAPTGCSNFIIFIGNNYRNNASSGDNSSDGVKDALLGTHTTSGARADPAAGTDETAAVTGTFSTKFGSLTCGGGSATINGSETGGHYALNWAKYMKNKAVAKTFSVGVLGPTCNAGYAAHLSKLGATEYGGGAFYPASDYEGLVDALKSAFNSILSVNSVFASVSLPVSVNTQGSYLNQVYVGMFRPDATRSPRWHGNLKQYKMKQVGDNLRLVDADDASAINSNTGFITECARSFWTPSKSNPDTYWINEQSGSCTIAGSASSNTPDGNVVEKGAQAYVLRQLTPADRKVLTCGSTMGSCSESGHLTDFTTSLSTTGWPDALFNATAGTSRNTLINWARGLNSAGELSKATTIMRPSSHGDVMHSRPVAINYGTGDASNVVVFYGANDGMLHAVNGNRTAASTFGSTTYAAGAELWSFMPPEFYGNIKRLYDNSPKIKFKTIDEDGATNKSYGMDGPIAAFRGTVSGSTKTYIYATMRRGGRAVYGFDVSSPASPSLMWKAGCSGLSSSDCSTGMSGIGQTWAAPKSFFATAYESGTKPLLIMGGGYDDCEDTDTGTANHSCDSNTKGKYVYILDATTGTRVAAFPTVAPWKNATPRGVIADAVIVNEDGKAKYAYIADLGGVVYRLAFPTTNVEDWSMTAIAKLGCDDLIAGCTANRKFMFAASVLSVGGGVYDILIGTGDREKPVSQYTASAGVPNKFFMVQDKPADSENWLELSEHCGDDQDVICLATLANKTNSCLGEDGLRGWYINLDPTEQVVTSALTIFGVTSFSTHQPATGNAENQCGVDLGTTRVYNIGYSNSCPIKEARYEDVAGDGLPPSAVGGLVTLDTGETVPFCIGCSGESPLEAAKATQASEYTRAKNRLYWYVDKN